MFFKELLCSRSTNNWITVSHFATSKEVEYPQYQHSNYCLIIYNSKRNGIKQRDRCIFVWLNDRQHWTGALWLVTRFPQLKYPIGMDGASSTLLLKKSTLKCAFKKTMPHSLSELHIYQRHSEVIRDLAQVLGGTSWHFFPQPNLFLIP